jgi:hypothetical protein
LKTVINPGSHQNEVVAASVVHLQGVSTEVGEGAAAGGLLLGGAAAGGLLLGGCCWGAAGVERKAEG